MNSRIVAAPEPGTLNDTSIGSILERVVAAEGLKHAD